MKFLLFILFSATATSGRGMILWNESVNGPLSNDSGTPTSLAPLQAGTNSIIGMTQVQRDANNWVSQPDFFTFTVPSNLLIGAIYLQIDKPNVWAWIGDTGFGNQLAFTSDSLSGNLLPQWTLTSIGSGAYGMYMDNYDHTADLSLASYRLDFFVQSIPEPSTLSLVLIGLGFLGFRGWKSKLRLNRNKSV